MGGGAARRKQAAVGEVRRLNEPRMPNKAAGTDRPLAGACGYQRRWRGGGTTAALGGESAAESLPNDPRFSERPRP